MPSRPAIFRSVTTKSGRLPAIIDKACSAGGGVDAMTRRFQTDRQEFQMSNVIDEDEAAGVGRGVPRARFRQA